LKTADRLIQNLRIRKAAAYIPKRSRILDIGCGDGALFRHLAGQFTDGVGIDPELEESVDLGTYRLIKGWFPNDLPATECFDAIVMLATLEHVTPDSQTEIARGCFQLLNPGGRLIITVPSKRIDAILDVLKRMRLIDGMSLEQHYGYDPRQTPSIFSTDGLQLVKAGSFELGLNHLFVFEKPAGSDPR
jgi:SAM-dependent methyltransferase